MWTVGVGVAVPVFWYFSFGTEGDFDIAATIATFVGALAGALFNFGVKVFLAIYAEGKFLESVAKRTPKVVRISLMARNAGAGA
jgi:hypothetical protein